MMQVQGQWQRQQATTWVLKLQQGRWQAYLMQAVHIPLIKKLICNSLA
jgi:hypothetical protein